MAVLTIDELKRVIEDVAGAEEDFRKAGDITDQPFDTLGIDSLALMEAAARIQQEHGIYVSDDALGNASTPGELLALINNSILAVS